MQSKEVSAITKYILMTDFKNLKTALSIKLSIRHSHKRFYNATMKHWYHFIFSHDHSERDLKFGLKEQQYIYTTQKTSPIVADIIYTKRTKTGLVVTMSIKV